MGSSIDGWLRDTNQTNLLEVLTYCTVASKSSKSIKCHNVRRASAAC